MSGGAGTLLRMHVSDSHDAPAPLDGGLCKMTTEELLMDTKPLMLEIEYADEADSLETPVARQNDLFGASSNKTTAPDTTDKAVSKKDQILDLYAQGTTDIASIVRKLGVRSSYVAQVLQAAGHLKGYFDLYTTTSREQNIYSRFFRNALSFKTVEAARESVEKIDRLYNYFERLGDRAGQHQAMVLALTGKNRARWSGKTESAEIFNEWLMKH